MKKDNNHPEEELESKKIYSEKFSADRNKSIEALNQSLKKSSDIEFNNAYKDFLMNWKDEGYSVENLKSLKEIKNTEGIDALREPLINFFRECNANTNIIHNLIDILKRGGKVNENDNPISIRNFSLLTILFYKELSDNQKVTLFGSDTTEESNFKDDENLDIDLFEEVFNDQEKDDDLYDIINLNNEIIFLDKEKDYKEDYSLFVIEALEIANKERLSNLEIKRSFKEDIIKINSFYAEIFIYDENKNSNQLRENEVFIDLKRFYRDKFIPDFLILVEIDFDRNCIFFKGILTTEELCNILEENKSLKASKLILDNLTIHKNYFIGGIDRVFYLTEILNPLSINKEKLIEILQKSTNEIHHIQINKIKHLNKDISFAFRQLSDYLKSGLPLCECLELVSEDVSNKNLKNIFLDIASELMKGEELRDSMSKYFESEIIISLIEAGESGGVLSDVLIYLAEYIDQNLITESRSKRLLNLILLGLITSFAIYATGLAILIPKFPYLIIFSIVFLIGGLSYIFDYPQIYLLDKSLCKIPIINKIIIRKFLSSMVLLVKSGIPIVESLEITKYQIGNLYFRDYITNIKMQIYEGISFSDCFSGLNFKPIQLINMSKIGEETGNLLFMLIKLENIYKSKINMSLREIKKKIILFLLISAFLFGIFLIKLI